MDQQLKQALELHQQTNWIGRCSCTSHSSARITTAPGVFELIINMAVTGKQDKAIKCLKQGLMLYASEQGFGTILAIATWILGP